MILILIIIINNGKYDVNGDIKIVLRGVVYCKKVVKLNYYGI